MGWGSRGAGKPLPMSQGWGRSHRSAGDNGDPGGTAVLGHLHLGKPGVWGWGLVLPVVPVALAVPRCLVTQCPVVLPPVSPHRTPPRSTPPSPSLVTPQGCTLWYPKFFISCLLLSPSHSTHFFSIPSHCIFSIPWQPMLPIPSYPTFSIAWYPAFSIPQHPPFSMPQHPMFSIPQHPTFSIPCHLTSFATPHSPSHGTLCSLSHATSYSLSYSTPCCPLHGTPCSLSHVPPCFPSHITPYSPSHDTHVLHPAAPHCTPQFLTMPHGPTRCPTPHPRLLRTVQPARRTRPHQHLCPPPD